MPEDSHDAQEPCATHGSDSRDAQEIRTRKETRCSWKPSPAFSKAAARIVWAMDSLARNPRGARGRSPRGWRSLHGSVREPRAAHPLLGGDVPAEGSAHAGRGPQGRGRPARCISRFHLGDLLGRRQHGGQTVAIAELIQNEAATPAVAHFTCVSATASLVATEVEALRAAGVETVLALRGDLAPGQEPADFRYAYELIPRLKAAGLCVGAAAYPEGHIDCLDPRENIRHLRAKQDAGADFFITQLFFNNDDFYRFREAAESAGVAAPISCGIMPFLGKSQIQRMVFLCGSSLPHQAFGEVRGRSGGPAPGGHRIRLQPAGRSRSPRRQRPARVCHEPARYRLRRRRSGRCCRTSVNTVVIFSAISRAVPKALCLRASDVVGGW